MKTLRIFLLPFYIFLTGCSSTIQIKNEQMTYESLNEQLAGERCKIILADSGFVITYRYLLHKNLREKALLKGEVG
jgi:hypothetical protein